MVLITMSRHGGSKGTFKGTDRYFKRIYELTLPIKTFQTKYSSLLIKFIMTTDDKYKTS